ncbi:MAG: 50S ribosomal protein L23 [Candidatus Omnitrophica bacterium]|nr:50S ribosomal protein L23 [Candidatus Omnitrophota bacterium]
MIPQDVVRTLLRTEKGTLQQPQRKYLFDVHPSANKVQIRQAVETLYAVKVAKVNTSIVHGKLRRLRAQLGRRADWKKAIVTLRDGHTIEVGN